MGALKINVSDTSGQSWPLVLHQTLNQKSAGWGPGIKFLNASDSSGKWAGIGGMTSSEYANNNDLVFYTSAEARFRMNNNTFYPIGDAVYNLGGSTVRWNDIHGVNFCGDSAILKAEYALRFTNINTEAYLAANSSEGLFLAVYGSGNSGKSIYLETYDTDIYHRKNGTNYNILTSANYSNWACPESGSNNYIKVYNSNNVGGSSSVTFNDLAKQGFAAAMIHAAEDSPRGKAGWVHGLSMAWGTGSNTNWISQLAFGVQDSNGLWYRTNQSACVGKPWKRVLDSSNYTDYAAPAAYSWRTGNASDANGSSHYLNGAWRTSDGCANVPQGNGFLWSINGDGGGNTTVQFSGTYNMSNIYYRSKWYDNGWTNWYTLLSSNNYNSYSPTLTGGGASGTWGINITGNAASASQLARPLHMYGGNNGKPCYPCFARITITSTYTSRPGMIILSSRDRYLCNLQIRFAGGNSYDPSTLYLHHDSGNSYHGIFAVKVQAGVWDLYYTKSQDWDDITVYQYSSSDFSISFPGGYITSVPSNAISSSPLPNRGTVNYGNSKPTHEDFAGMVYYQLI